MESTQVYWDDVEVGQEIPTLVKHPTHIQMLMWGGAVDDYNPMHADNEIATRAGYSEPIVFGPLIWSFLVQMLSGWLGVDGWLKKIAVRHHLPALAGDDVVCRGKITDKYVKDGEHYVELQIQADYPSREGGTTGSATVILPPKAHAHALPSAEPIPDTIWNRIL
ncbi:MAG: MaoC family dehydratase N-terminal domain-containing protein [Desulfobacteraceae bacterium]|nr:MaoC family dehydratase N-terminal domain-containing protein [Desulfobacteraceae bacterium]